MIELIGDGYLGKSDMKRCEEERRKVSGDPVGSTDPKVILWGPQILRCQGFTIPAPIRHVKCPLHAIQVFNARLKLVSGVKHPNVAYFWHLTPA